MPIPRTPIKNPDPFARAIPGQSLTEPPGLRPYEKPPAITTPGRLLETIEPVLKEEVSKSIADLLEMGISCETMADGICKKYFMEGAATPDVVELAKPGIFMIVAQIGDDQNVEDMKLFNEGPAKKKLSEIEKLKLMEKIDPKKYQKIEDRMNRKGSFEEELEGISGRVEDLDSEGEEFEKALREMGDVDDEEYDRDSIDGEDEEYEEGEGSFLDMKEAPSRIEYEDEYEEEEI